MLSTGTWRAPVVERNHTYNYASEAGKLLRYGSRGGLIAFAYVNGYLALSADSNQRLTLAGRI